MHLSVKLFNSGLGAGITRAPRVDVTSQDLVPPPKLMPAWHPNWADPQTIGVQFADVIEPPRSESTSTSPLTHQGTFDSNSAFLPAAASPTTPGRRTRIDVPEAALSITDRLFYLLQPPIESLLSGQELRMPFEPFPFQYQGIAWLFSRSCGLLADEMGLGKTMQAISAFRLLLRAGQIRSVLLVCPKPLITNWQRELGMWAEEIPVVAIEGPSPRRRMLWEMQNIPVKIANYELLVRDFEMIGEDDFPAFDLVILDEAQRIKNRESQTNQAARGLRRQRSWALTGTPIENRPSDFVSLLEFIGAIPAHGASGNSIGSHKTSCSDEPRTGSSPTCHLDSTARNCWNSARHRNSPTTPRNVTESYDSASSANRSRSNTSLNSCSGSNRSATTTR